MSRIFVISSRGQALKRKLQTLLGPEYCGSVNNLTMTLREFLPEGYSGERGTIHTNRIHSFLRSDHTTALNENTFELIEEATNKLIEHLEKRNGVPVVGTLDEAPTQDVNRISALALETIRESLLHVRTQYGYWLDLRLTTEAEKELARTKIRMIDDALSQVDEYNPEQ